jgi:hypothetical protein
LVLEKLKKILEKSLKSHGIFSQKRCMNPACRTAQMPWFTEFLGKSLVYIINMLIWKKVSWQLDLGL